MTGFSWWWISVALMGVLAYQRASRVIWIMSLGLFLVFATRFHGGSAGIFLSWIIAAFVFLVLSVPRWRRHYLSRPLFNFYRKMMPTMSLTEREAISAGTVTWEGELFCGHPDWHKLLQLKAPVLSAEEQAFIDGPAETLCRMIDDWDITHHLADLPPDMWRFLKDNGFFALGIPKQYGGKEFSAYGHSQLLVKLSGRSVSVSTTVSVPNSLGPAELLLHYGTQEQKNYYLPRLAQGKEVPCFALTSPEAGSDAGAMTDHGVVCFREYEGKKTLGILVNWDKRYITLAPVATVIGLAFKLYDPDKLLGDTTYPGITCALIPRETPGVTIGRRHFPLHTVFQNGPIQGKDVFMPVEWIIGGKEQAGKGWRMLMECLAAGRAITLPATALGGAKLLSYATGAYAYIRQQFNRPIGDFEGIQEPLSRLAAYTYLIDAARTLAVGAIDAGEKPAVASAIVKCHATSMGRQIAIDAMDIHGGKGICLGPKNYVGRGYESAPIAITVEGANILTRSMIIFGQGAIRCHPYVLAEMEAAQMPDAKLALAAFDKAVMKHAAFGLSNMVRSVTLALCSSRLVTTPGGSLKRFYQHASRFSAALALMADMSMLSLGGQLKRKEGISARLGDILSYLYLLSAVFKHFHEQGANQADLPLVRYASQHCLYEIQQAFDGLFKNFPNRSLAGLLRVLIFPLGMWFSKPDDRLQQQVSTLLMAPTATRERLSAGIYTSAAGQNVLADIEDALIKTKAAEPVLKVLREAALEDSLSGYTRLEQAQSALTKKLITLQAFDLFMQGEEARKKVIAVDDFAPEDLIRHIAADFQQSVHV